MSPDPAHSPLHWGAPFCCVSGKGLNWVETKCPALQVPTQAHGAVTTDTFLERAEQEESTWGKPEPTLPATSRECSCLTQGNLHIQLSSLPFPPPVCDHLRVEGDGPGYKVNPAYHLVYDANDVAVDHQEANPWARMNLGAG